MIGEILNHKYRIIELIGTGGMAHVYRAINMSSRKIVAIKMLKEEFGRDPEFLRRFEREARASLHLSHENIVRAYGVGQHNGLPYIVLEYVEGSTLKELIKQNGVLPTKTAISICCQLLDALDAAHSHGIIHRDVKPQNIIINSKGRVKLTDFGIARDVSASTVTFAGSNVVGSVHYISPEQAKGDLVSEASDVYSVGVTLYEMLTGDVPFKAETTVSVALMHLQNEPRQPIELNDKITPALNDIILRSMQKDPLKRYSTAKSMRSDLVRSIQEPYGTFPRVGNSAPSNDLKPVKAKVSTYLIIALSVFVPILLIVVGIIAYGLNCGGNKTIPEVSTPPASVAPPTDVPFVTDIASEPPTATTIVMPELRTLPFSKALQELSRYGFTNIFVSIEENTEAEMDTVLYQSISYGEVVELDKPVQISIARPSKGLYKADVSFTFVINENNSLVQFAYETTDYDIKYYLVLYQTTATIEKPNNTVFATVYSKEPADREILLFVNGELVEKAKTSFSE
ncbi:MAG: protein kinase [Eubacteriales bacterium]|nr:protein kinase [Eubacteriales bacterium]